MARRRCVDAFARQYPAIGLDLFIAEGSLDGRWEIPDGPRVYRFDIDPQTCLFAKENLLNLAIDRLPDRYESVLWIDADVLLLQHDFADRLVDALHRHVVVQAFRRLMYLNSDGAPQLAWRQSVAARNIENGTRSADPRQAFPGLAWAARRELLARVDGLYDRVIIGGDYMLCYSSSGNQRLARMDTGSRHEENFLRPSASSATNVRGGTRIAGMKNNG